MNATTPVLILICLAAAAAAGCTAGISSQGTPLTTPVVTETLTVTGSCTSEADCVPAQCCHPASCTLKAAAPDCSAKLCTMSCEGPIDCGAGSCGCAGGTCTVVPATTASTVAVTIAVNPKHYSPVMSSTPGIGLTPRLTGYVAADTVFNRNASDIGWDPVNYEWNATFGEFLTWDAPDFRVHRIGNPAATGNRTVYWTFTDKPAESDEPVGITVTARDMTRDGTELGTSTVILTWDGDYEVSVRESG